ncbi:MAG: flagellar biosynthesis anti-sigma factor FlgM [Hafnia alvei]|jgi:negative regulator of flagellin synthesis FlgM|uniref:Negative regulator of flagellin synthesis n=1 Tax=Hafnia alvei TaxID=569 RepID=A0ABD7Q1Y8_HAFAL|nr:flagellar biosynthesis anti-sigma factor FlgM [Hafnia alvei]NEY28135.1 anti-sigma-28 factor FlgM [Escherichia coli]ANC41516.1 flagellar biosynthesis anti-sigma factor FlgM [Hafnia alvei]KAA0261110.1 anti-sigma-28 factor FlgM [Hafnia alvei]KID06116.1 flagellar biosynthesis anti-sigma factor FlgM [Hafnia alvei]MBI0274427.1 anti-sigma-28 factor FlgM [Hafnia alvei]
MSIDRTHSLSGVSPIQPREASEIQQQKRKEATSQPAVDGAQVKLSDAQSRLMQPNGQDINVERVEALKLAIRNGELSMDTGKIADALLQDTHDLLKSND